MDRTAARGEHMKYPAIITADELAKHAHVLALV
jgi:hypothetical protein